jgi:hypothetical protein
MSEKLRIQHFPGETEQNESVPSGYKQATRHPDVYTLNSHDILLEISLHGKSTAPGGVVRFHFAKF